MKDIIKFINESKSRIKTVNIKSLYNAMANDKESLLYTIKDIRYKFNSYIDDYKEGKNNKNLFLSNSDIDKIFKNHENDDFVGYSLSNTGYEGRVEKAFDKTFKTSYMDYIDDEHIINKDDISISWLEDKNGVLVVIIETEPCVVYISNFENAWITEYIKSKENKFKKGTDGYYHPQNRDELKDLIGQLTSKKKNANLNKIDISKITDLSFVNFYYKNPDVSKWDVSKVENMNHLFNNSYIDCDLSKWDVSKVENMYCMFEQCYSTLKTCKIENWDVSNVKNMGRMFSHSDVNVDLSKWNPKNVDPTTIIKMFENSPMEKNPPQWWKDIYKKHILNNSEYKETHMLPKDVEKYDKIAQS